MLDNFLDFLDFMPTISYFNRDTFNTDANGLESSSAKGRGGASSFRKSLSLEQI